MHPKVGIILLNWNSFNHTSNCIQSLQLCDYPNFEIIVVDNGSEDGSGKLQ
jgi:GT2 family glycosyltransferase